MDGGVRIVFDPSIDRGAFVGPATAAAGASWLGPLGLLARLESDLGLAGGHASPAARALALATTLATAPPAAAFWLSSFATDPLATCHRLLADRDALALAGWRGQPASARLAELWTATSAAAPGIPYRIAHVRDALARPRRSVDVHSIELVSHLYGLPPAWRGLLGALAERGVHITERALENAAATGDLAAARATWFTPHGDGSLVLLRPHGPLAAADEVAAHLATLPAGERVVVVGADAVLDAALARHGLPRAGARVSGHAALVRLVIEAAFEPMEPADLHALLCFESGPVPRAIAPRLLSALRAFPGRRSPAWLAALDNLGNGFPNADLLVAAAPRAGAIARAEITRRLAAVQAMSALRLVERTAAPAFTLHELRRLCDELADDDCDDDAHGGHVTLPEAGLASVAQPGAVLAHADTIVWWSFTRASAPPPARVRLSADERAALERLGVVPPDPGRALEAEALRWRRPLAMAHRSLVLVCPATATNGAGDKEFPHPLWDELVAAMPDRRGAVILERTSLPCVRRTARPRPLPAFAVAVEAGRPIPLRPVESASSLERLLGCSLAYVFQYPGRLGPGLSSGPPAPSPLLYGRLAHHILAGAGAGAGPVDEARIDEVLAASCESLNLPRYQAERTTFKQIVLASARALEALRKSTGATLRGVELAQQRSLGDLDVRGVADLVWQNPDVVLDLKWGKTQNRDKLRAGKALQLAVYAQLFGTRDVAFFILKTQELLAAPGGRLPGAQIPGRAGADEMWRGAEGAIAERRAELARGHLVAPGPEVKDAPCAFCGHAGLCGKRGAA